MQAQAWVNNMRLATLEKATFLRSSTPNRGRRGRGSSSHNRKKPLGGRGEWKNPVVNRGKLHQTNPSRPHNQRDELKGTSKRNAGQRKSGSESESSHNVKQESDTNRGKPDSSRSLHNRYIWQVGSSNTQRDGVRHMTGTSAHQWGEQESHLQ